MKLSLLLKLISIMLFVFTFSVTFSFAGGNTPKCSGEPTTLAWSSSGNTSGGCGGNVTSGDASCSFLPTPNGSHGPFAAVGSCTVIFNCSNASGAWGTGDSASLTVDTTVSIHGEDRPGEQVAVITLAGGGLDATQMDAIKAGLRLRLSAIAVVHEVRFALTA